MITYTIEFWNPKTKKYCVGWHGKNYNMALHMFDKRYNQIHTRRLIVTEKKVIKQASAAK